MPLIIATTFVLAAFAAPADAQFSFGAQGAVITGVDDLSTILPGEPDLNSTFGFGARAVFQAPVLPIGLVAQGTYYFPDADDYRTYGLAARFRLSTPLISPYGLGGWQWRRTSTGGTSNTENGAMIGVGVELNLGVSLFLEGTYEFTEELPGNPDFDNQPIVIKGGIMFG
jgi:hypothetical protein